MSLGNWVLIWERGFPGHHGLYALRLRVASGLGELTSTRAEGLTVRVRWGRAVLHSFLLARPLTFPEAWMVNDWQYSECPGQSRKAGRAAASSWVLVASDHEHMRWGELCGPLSLCCGSGYFLKKSVYTPSLWCQPWGSTNEVLCTGLFT